MATLFKTDGTIQTVEPQNGSTFSLEELQGFVHGYIEIIQFADGDIVVVNEEGNPRGLPINWHAPNVRGCQLKGDVLLCKSSEVK